MSCWSMLAALWVKEIFDQLFSKLNVGGIGWASNTSSSMHWLFRVWHKYPARQYTSTDGLLDPTFFFLSLSLSLSHLSNMLNGKCIGALLSLVSIDQCEWKSVKKCKSFEQCYTILAIMYFVAAQSASSLNCFKLNIFFLVLRGQCKVLQCDPTLYPYILF